MTTPFPKVNSQQNAMNSILDITGQRQTYLGNSFSYALAVTLSSSSEVAKILLKNTSANVGLFCFARAVSSNGYMSLLTYSDATITSVGTPATPTELRPAYVTSPVGLLYSAPTIAANGSLVDVISANTSMGNSGLTVVVDPGHNLLITAVSPGATGGSPVSGYISLAWYQI